VTSRARSKDVVVIGAGAAGLRAGRALAEAGLGVTLLEARERIGGRIHTVPAAPERRHERLPVELGAEFVHGLPAESWTLIREAGLDTYELAGKDVHHDGNRLIEGAERAQGAFRVLEDMAAWWQSRPSGPDLTFAEYLRRASTDPGAASQAANYVEGFNAADRNRIGVAALVTQQRAEDRIDAERLFRIKRGYARLPEFLARKFEQAGGELLLGRRVTHIQWEPQRVAVQGVDTAGRTFALAAARAIVTLPLGVLKLDSVQFTPAPADRLLQAGRMEMGSVLRATLLFDAAFWREPQINRDVQGLPDMSFLFAPDETLPTWWTAAPDATPTLTAWVGGPKSLRLAERLCNDGRALRDECLNVLGRLFDTQPPRLQSLLLAFHCHDWQADPYSLGAYSYAPAGALDASERIAEPVDDTLFFAGEHTDITGHWGTVHGALESGQAAARRLLAAGMTD